MQIESISLIIAACVSAALAVASILRNFRDKLCLAFGFFCVLLFAHDVGAIVESLETVTHITSARLHTLLTLALGPSLLFLLREIFVQRALPVPGLVTVYLWASPPVIAVVALFMSFDLYPRIALQLDHLAHISLCFPGWLWLRSLGLAEREVKLSRERLRLRFSFWAGIITALVYVTDALHFSQSATANIPALGTLARTAYFIYLFQTFIQKELVTSEELITKVAHFGGISLLLSLLYTLLVSWVSNQQGLFFFNTFIASFMIIILFDPLRSLSSRLVRRAFLGRHLVLEQELNAVSQILMGMVEPNDIAASLKNTIKKCLGTEATSLYVLDRDGFSYLQIEPGEFKNAKELSATSPLIEYMTLRRGRPFVLESLENDRDFFRATKPHRFCEQCLEAMRTLNADFIIPFIHASKPVGFLAVLTGERVILSNEQLRLFMPVARQIAQVLKNSEIFNRLSDREKLAALGEMAAGLAHEIKNPLGAIKGAAELLTSSQSKEGQEEFLKIILDETKRLSGVLTDFLDYAKPRRTQISEGFDPLRVIDHAISLKDPSSKVDFAVQSDSGPVFVEGDPEHLKQVLLNLFLNATQALEGVEEPKIRIRVRAIRPRSPFSIVETLPLYKVWEGWRTQLGMPKSFVSIEVADNGVGISPDEMERIFVPFYTTKEKGTGLGLAICQRIIESMGGSIHVKAQYPKGTRFIIHLPMGKEETVGRVPLVEAMT